MSDADVQSYIKKMEDCGGKVERYSLIPAAKYLSPPPYFPPIPASCRLIVGRVEMPDGYVGAMDDHVVVETVEEDGVVTTQS